MDRLELSGFKQKIEDEWKVTAPQAVAPSTDQTPAVEKKTSFTVTIESVDQLSKIRLIKAIRALPSHDLDLKGAKHLVDTLPQVIAEHVSQEQADTLKADLEEAGATISVA